jgi:hypothetical protein
LPSLGERPESQVHSSRARGAHGQTAEQIAASLGLTRTTCYRYTRELSNAGYDHEATDDAHFFMNISCWITWESAGALQKAW